ncbi:Cell division control protein 4 [Cyphellophora attinorum]|uniref:Probable E3 ubiquitin ligase complex SCF subunit sconB n=1 Tax=Cyphellophora attinorum TaxID=1664694 RepID=A0A0N1P1K4_9EURO|nr:Cell division control protein 4 [Phialophora attinorum]KPI40883.1 Cell division control protein 4 [Phialophora attinorum]
MMDDSEDYARHALGSSTHSTKNASSGHASTSPTLAQFSFAPATQTTVVTTTTTTTTRFPPLLMRPPSKSYQLDSKQYPLAATPTPTALQNIALKVGGTSMIFREAADAMLAMEHLEDEQKILSSNNGEVKTVQAYESWVQTDPELASHPLAVSRSRLDRLASPDSFTDTDDEGIETWPSKRRRLSNAASSSRVRPLQAHPRIRSMQGTKPLTPRSQSRQRPDLRNSLLPSTSAAPLPSPGLDQPDSFQDILAADSEDDLHDPESEDHGSPADSTRRGISRDASVPTPPIDLDSFSNSVRPPSRRALSSVPARLHTTASPSGQDGSLPSPSLSPVTAAANLQNAGYFGDVDSQSDVASHASLTDDAREQRRSFDLKATDRPLHGSGASRFSKFSVAEIPAMLDFFEAVPDELKAYLMHQMLRRCPKETLHLIADVVNPALKCDFLTLLPSELALHIVQYLDLKSLARAAQVSKKWRQLINSDEKVWKELFDADGYELAEGELQQAIAEGWGWQDPSGHDGYEMDISQAGHDITDMEEYLSSSPSSQPQSGLTRLFRRSKRKAVSILSGPSKASKRRKTSRDASVDISSINWMEMMSTSEGPYNAASAAILAVPHPDVGLTSLRGLHLYKTLYRRHHMIRKNWMYEDAKPRHIAFRAHNTHVVTCLQFDTDKILTGSDDNNINVYDTKTGVLRARLIGHEGGVWALQYEGNTLVSGSTDRSVRVWNIETGEERQVFRGHTSTVRCLQVVMPVQIGETADGKAIMMPRQPLIITGSRDSTLRIWKLPKPEDPPFIQAESEGDTDDCPYFIRALTGHQHSVRAIAAYADTLVSGSYDCTVRVWRISTGETVHRLQGHTQKVYSVVLDQTRNRCISGSMDNMVKIWSLDTGAAIYNLEGHTSLVGLLDLNCDRLVSAAADSTLRIWDPDNGQCKATLSAHTGAITCFQHDGQKVISGSDRNLKLWNIKTGECVKDLLSDLSGVWQVKFNERRCVAAVQRDGSTFIEVIDFGAARDGEPECKRGRRIVVDESGREVINDDEERFVDMDGPSDH